MLLPKKVLEGVEKGEIDLAFRRWTRPTVKSGGTLRTRVGMLLIASVEPVDIGDITADDARRAGTNLGDLLDFLEAKEVGTVYRVELGGVGPDPRVALREMKDLTSDDLAEITARLDRLDRAGKRGSWTREFLCLIGRNPHVRAQDLADRLGLEKSDFKNDVRKLKNLGLTISHSPGYELSPRGLAYLDRSERGDDRA